MRRLIENLQDALTESASAAMDAVQAEFKDASVHSSVVIASLGIKKGLMGAPREELGEGWCATVEPPHCGLNVWCVFIHLEEQRPIQGTEYNGATEGEAILAAILGQS